MSIIRFFLLFLLVIKSSLSLNSIKILNDINDLTNNININDLTNNININDNRIIVIGDIHDDLDRLKSILLFSNIIDKKDNWIADNNTFVIQLGDQIDSKEITNNEHHFRVIYYTEDLKQKALKKNGDFVSIIGNHEIYNLNKILKKPLLKEIISKRPVIYNFNNFLFCHASFLNIHYNLLKQYNLNINDINIIWNKYILNLDLTYKETIILNKLILDPYDSITFIRRSDEKYEQINLYNKLNIDYVFVGHSIYKSINLKNKIWYLDLYLKDAFDNRVYNYIDINGDTVNIINYNNYM